MNQFQGNATGARRSLLPNRSGKAVPIVLGVIVVAAIAFAVYWFAFRKAGGDASKLVTSYIPKEVQVVGGLDVKGFYASPLYADLGDFEKKITEDKKFKAMSEKTGFDYKKVETVAFGIGDVTSMMGRAGDGEKAPKFVAVVKGSWDSAKMMSSMKEMAGDKAEEKDIEGVKAMVSKGVSAGFPAEGVMLAGSADMFATAIKLSKGTGESVDANAEIGAVRKFVDEGATFWVAGVVPKEAAGQMPGDFGTPSAGALSISLASGIEVKGAVKLASAEEATKAQTQLKMGIGLASGFAASVPDVGEDLKKIVEGVKIEASNDVLTVSASASADVVKKLIAAGKKQGMLEL